MIRPIPKQATNKPQDVRILEAFQRGRLPEGKDLQRCINWIKPRADRATKRAERQKAIKANPILTARAKQKSEHSGILDSADDWFSRFIRMRDSHEGAIGNRFCVCCTCGRSTPILESQAGHWQGRGLHATRYDEHNVHAQCETCNSKKWGNGKPKEHEVYIGRAHGLGEVARIKLAADLSKKYHRRLSDYELTKIAETYKAKALALGWPE